MSPKALYFGIFRTVCRLSPVVVAAVLVVATLSGPSRAEVDFALMGKVRFAVSQGDLDGAAELLGRALARLEDNETEAREALLRELADIQARAGQHSDSAETLEMVAELAAERLDNRHPDMSSVYEYAGNEHLRAGNYQAAIGSFESAVDVDRVHHSAGHPLVVAALERLAGLYQTVADSSGADEMAQQIQFAQVIGDRTAASYSPRAEEVDAGYGNVDDDSLARVTIYYATDREQTGVARPNDYYGSDRGELEYGSVVVSIPREHRPGQVEEPFSRWNRENPQRHIVLLTLTTMNRDEVFTEMESVSGGSDEDEAFVFVHGYNLSFAEAARRTAQVAYDLNFNGLPIMYSWPSRDSPYDYISDTETVRQSGRELSRFLEDVVARSGAERIHLVAHGMGNRALVDALELFALRNGDDAEAVAFEQVVFATPDMDAELFRQMIETIEPIAQRLTLYVSDNDPALHVARELFGDQPRAGEAGSSILISQHIDTVDVTNASADGGSDLPAYSAALADMLAMFWHDEDPADRCGMALESSLDGVYWSFSETACGGSAYLSALTLLRNKGPEATAFAERMLDQWREYGDADAVNDWETIQAHLATLASR
jgi:esterase/lipase superfamily enzyme